MTTAATSATPSPTAAPAVGEQLSLLGTPPVPAAAAPATGTPAPAPVAGAAGATPPAATPPAPEAPKGIELKLPEGFDAKQAEWFKAKATELKLDSAQAQALFDGYQQQAAEQAKAQQAAFQEAAAKQQAAQAAQVKAWVDAIKADPEVGGGKPEVLQANVELARRAVDKFGGKELAEALDKTGLGNHPLLVRAFTRIGKALAEDSVSGTQVDTGSGAQDLRSNDAFLRSMYPSMYPAKKE